MREHSKSLTFQSGCEILRSGEPEMGLLVVEKGTVEVINPAAKAEEDRVLAKHGPGEFLGDIDVLTGRPLVVKAFAREETTLRRVEPEELGHLLALMPRLGEKLLVAFAIRREFLKEKGVSGHRVLGTRTDADATLIQEFLFKNFVPYTFFNSEGEEGKKLMEEWGVTCDDLPVVECRPGDGRELLKRPTIKEVASCVGVVRACPEKVYDLAIIGAGPAGMTAAVYAASEGLSVIVLDKLGPGGQASGTSLIENFIGFPSGLSGNELAARGFLQMLKFGVKLAVPVAVKGIRLPKDGDEDFEIETDDATVRSRVVLAATGAKWKRLAAKDAEQYERNGIYYSATAVESRFCVGKSIAVVGAGNSGGQAAMFLSECAPKVYLIVHSDSMEKGMSAYLHERVKNNPRVEVIFNSEVTEAHGTRTAADEPKLTGITIKDVASGKTRDLDVSALFAFIGADPLTDYVPKEAARGEQGHLLTGHQAMSDGAWPVKERGPCELETSIPRLLAAGDVRAGSTKRVGFAVGDGALAVTCAHRLLQR